MTLSFGIVSVALLIGIGLLAIGLKAYKQNRPLLQTLRTGNTDIKPMFWQSLVVWSPIAVVIVVLLGIAYAITWASTELVYRYTTLDEFCEVKGLDSPAYIACTGMGNELDANKIRQLGPGENIERQLFLRYRNVRKRLLHAPLDELRLQAKDRPAFLRSISPAGIFGLPPTSEEDSVLSQLVTEKRRLVASPIPMPNDIASAMSYRQSVDTRNRLLREMDAKIAERRKALYIAEYGQLTDVQRVQQQRKNRLVLLLNRVKARIDPQVQNALLADGNTDADFIRSGLVRSLARSERDALAVLSREIATPDNASYVYDTLNIAPECSVATASTAVRLSADDGEPAAFIGNNNGSFRCFTKTDSAKPFRLASVGFRKSVFLSLSRLHDEVGFAAFKKLAMLEQQVANGTVDAKTASNEVANVVPPVIQLGRQDCGLLRPFNCVMNAMAASAEATYRRYRNQIVESSAAQANAESELAALTMQQKIDRARITADDQAKQMHEAGNVTANAVFTLSDVLHMLGWTALFLLALRSFFHVFALELFDRDAELRISFDVENPIEGNYVSGPEITIDRDFVFPIINKGSLTNTLADIKFAPWRWSAPIARILHGCYFLFNWSVFSPPSQQEGAEQVKGMEASARNGFSIVEWRMQPGEEVIFNYRHFYGASANVKLKTDVSFKLSTLLLGRIFFHYACCEGGEGRLLLEARVHNTSRDSMSSIKPSRLVAWNRHAQFSADSHRQPWKSLINPYTIVRESTPGLAKGLVIIAPESESPQFFGMGIGFIKRIFSRIF